MSQTFSQISQTGRSLSAEAASNLKVPEASETIAGSEAKAASVGHILRSMWKPVTVPIPDLLDEDDEDFMEELSDCTEFQQQDEEQEYQWYSELQELKSPREFQDQDEKKEEFEDQNETVGMSQTV